MRLKKVLVEVGNLPAYWSIVEKVLRNRRFVFHGSKSGSRLFLQVWSDYDSNIVNGSFNSFTCDQAIVWYLGLISIVIEVPISQSRMLSLSILF